MTIDGTWPSRRDVLVLGGALGGSIAMPTFARAEQSSAHYFAARAELAQGRAIGQGRVTLDIPRLAESGNSVALKVKVASPMSAADHVRTIHILSEKNPIALVARFRLGPRAGRAEVETNIRLAATQNVHAIAEMSDGSLWEAETEVVVLLAACLDGA